METKRQLIVLILMTLFQAFSYARAQPYIGINYGEVADNLPPPEATARLLASTTISKLRLYGADPAIIRALAGTNISIVVGAANGDIPTLAADPNAAASWAAANVLAFLPASAISLVSVGNEALSAGDPNLAAQLLPAMQNLRAALATSAPGVKVSTVHSMAVLAQSDPPSSGAFHADVAPELAGILGFLRETGAPFMVNPYPYFAYRSDPRPETLAFCLFQPNAGRVDAGSGKTYANMFDAQVDAVRAALGAAGFPETEVVVAETGWPYRGDDGEVGATVENARAFNGNLVAHLRSMAGTPMVPGESVDTYIFALYDEDLKPGPTSERSFGLYRPDLSMAYDVGLSKSNSDSSPAGTANPAPSQPDRARSPCVPIPGAGGTQANYACSQPGVDCGPVQPGSNCFIPNTATLHAAYAMNLLCQVASRNPRKCNFCQTATLTADYLSLLTDPHKQEIRLRNVVQFSFSLLLYMALPLLFVLT